jgi:CheY-like chemotaxis protein
MKRKKVLLAEDDLDDQQLFYDFLNHRSDIHLLPMVENGVELFHMLNMIAYDDALPQIIVLDHNMPKRNGFQTLELLKAAPRFQNIPVMIYSTYIDQQLKNACYRKGASAVVTKPITKEDYNKMVEMFLSFIA